MGHHFQPPPPAAVSRVLARFNRDDLASFIAIAIDLLDVTDGDPDVEANGDEQDHDSAEDEEANHRSDGPGCPLADAGEAMGDECDASLPEGHQDAAGIARRALPHEDAEDGGDAEKLAVSIVLPRYGRDQSRGPLNRAEAWRPALPV